MKIAILYICTGRYNQFFEGFYKSSEKYFLPENSEKHYFVFTDDLNLSKQDNVTLLYKECKGFPMDSLMRFEMFIAIRDQLLEYDYSYFFNSNMEFVSEVGEEILPESEGQIVFTLNAGYYNKTSFRYPYERNKKSTAFIKYRRKADYKYVIGGLNGGRTSDYIRFSKICHHNILEDQRNNVMAIYHDESHINKYYFENGGMLMSSSYAYPEGAELPFAPRIIIRDKVRVDGYFDKVADHSFGTRVIKGMHIIYKAVIWPFL